MISVVEAADKLYCAAIGLKKEKTVRHLARLHLPKFRAFFRDQKTITLAEFGKYRFLFTEEYRRFREETNYPNEFFTTHDWDRIWNNIDQATFDDLQRTIADAEGDGVMTGVQDTAEILKQFDRAKTFTLANPRAVKWFQDNGGSLQYIRGIQDTTRDQLQTIIVNAIDEGWSYNQTAKEISDRFDDFSRDRAQLIATNEAAHAYESGSFMFEEDLEADGVELEKSWENSGDDKVSDGCLENSAAGWIPLHEPFPSGHMYPPRFPGCRCWHIVRQVGGPAQNQAQTEQPATPDTIPSKWDTFTPAKTVGEFETRLNGFITSQTDPASAPFKQGIDFKGIALASQNSILKAIETTLGRYGIKVTRIATASRTKNIGIYQHPRYGPASQWDQIAIQKTFLRNPIKETERTALVFEQRKAAALKDIDRQLENPNISPMSKKYLLEDKERLKQTLRWTTYQDAEDPVHAVIKHEAYHAVYTRRGLSTKFLDALDKFKVSKNDEYSVSQYAASRKTELFAEAATAIDLGVPIPDSIRKAVMETLEGINDAK